MDGTKLVPYLRITIQFVAVVAILLFGRRALDLIGITPIAWLTMAAAFANLVAIGSSLLRANAMTPEAKHPTLAALADMAVRILLPVLSLTTAGESLSWLVGWNLPQYQQSIQYAQVSPIAMLLALLAAFNIASAVFHSLLLFNKQRGDLEDATKTLSVAEFGLEQERRKN